MAKKKSKMLDPVQTLREIALAYPESSETTSCNKAAFKAGKKSFLFVGQKEDSYNVMLKLGDSLDEATLLESKRPENFNVGKGGWTTLRFPLTDSPDGDLFDRWIEESYRLLATKTLVRELDES
jgi:hypothetical protein